MKAIILAAGKGVRMGKYTQDVPKGMLSVNGKTLIEWQMQALRRGGVDTIAIGTGYQKDTIPYTDVTYYHNPDFATTNMVETLMCARPELDSGIIISYADIVYTSALVKQLAEMEAPVAVAVDAAWRDYWTLRFGSAEEDLETLTVRDGLIVELGKEVATSEGIDYRYIGLIKVSREAWPEVLALYDVLLISRQPKFSTSRNASWANSKSLAACLRCTTQISGKWTSVSTACSIMPCCRWCCWLSMIEIENSSS